MSKSYREHRPLLCDEFSDEELDNTSPKFQRRVRYSVSSTGRVKTHAKGAAAILTRWPEHLSTILTYWWMGLGMIAVLIFVIYNSIMAIAVLPPTHMRPAKILTLEQNAVNGFHESLVLPNIFMHIFVTSNDDLNINDYLTLIEPFSKKYYAFKKNIIVVVNDVSDDVISISDEMRNEIALNSLWSDSKDVERHTFGKNITFKVISLTKYMDESPIKNHWRRIPKQFIEFLTRCIAIWDKGGIAFDLKILTSNSPSPVYIDKIHQFLNKYVNLNKTTSLLKLNTKKTKKKVNNIRDIINNLENEEKNNNVIKYNLSEAENREIISTANNDKRKKRDKAIELLLKDNENYPSQKNNKDIVENDNKTELLVVPELHNNVTTESKQKLLPMFLKYFFRNAPNNLIANISKNYKKSNLTKHISKSNAKLKRNRSQNRTSKSFVSATTKLEENSQNIITNKEDNSRLTIDLQGNLVATDTSCHAFIGTIFSNAIHHSGEESLTDFIIKELSMFCKGILSSCNGIDVILL